MRSRIAATATVVVAIVVAATAAHAAPAQGAPSPATDSASVVLRVRVVDDARDIPLQAAEVMVLVDSAQVGPAELTADDGIVERRVSRDSLSIRVRRIGYAMQVRFIDATAPEVDTVHVEMRLEWADVALRRKMDSLRTEYWKPTAVTPCRPANSTAEGIGLHIRRLLNGGTIEAIGLGDLEGATVEHVIDRDRCRAAAAVIGRASDGTSEGIQVHLFRLGNRGWAAYEPAFLGGHYEFLFILDSRLRRIRETLAF